MKHLLTLFAAAALGVSPGAVRAQPQPGELDALLGALPGNEWTVLVENESGSATYYQQAPHTGLAPASNTKLFTTAAALGLLGTNYAFQTRLYADGPITNGTLAGNLNLVCEHDPTWNSTVFTNARVPLDHIAAQLKALGLSAIAGKVQGYGACAYDLRSTGFLLSRSVQARNAEAAVALLAALQQQGISVSGPAEGQTGFSAPGTLLYTHHSSDLSYEGKPLRLDAVCIPLLKVSHNVMADLLCRHLGWKLAGQDSYSAGTAQALHWLGDTARLDTRGLELYDGSGLSRRNRVSAAQCVALLRYLLVAYPAWSTGLPVGCADGTIRRRFCGTFAAGRVHAKTGSLRTAIALSGYLDNRFDHQRYLFSFISNRTNIDQTATRQTIDNALVLFAAPLPIQPQLALSSDKLTLSWTPIAGLKYFLQYKEPGSETGWQAQGRAVLATNSGELSIEAPVAGMPGRFYRLQAAE